MKKGLNLSHKACTLWFANVLIKDFYLAILQKSLIEIKSHQRDRNSAYTLLAQLREGEHKDRSDVCSVPTQIHLRSFSN